MAIPELVFPADEQVSHERDKDRPATPRAFYLSKLYHRGFFRRTEWIDRHMQAVPGRYLCSDLSFKNAKKIYVDGETPFVCTLTVMNEYNQVFDLLSLHLLL